MKLCTRFFRQRFLPIDVFETLVHWRFNCLSTAHFSTVGRALKKRNKRDRLQGTKSNNLFVCSTVTFREEQRFTRCNLGNIQNKLKLVRRSANILSGDTPSSQYLYRTMAKIKLYIGKILDYIDSLNNSFAKMEVDRSLFQQKLKPEEKKRY